MRDSLARPLASHPIPPPFGSRQIDEILQTPDLEIRNLRITQAYSDLAAAMARVLRSRDLNWCCFATWASKTAGYSIRKVEPSGLAELLTLARDIRPRRPRLLGKRLAGIAETVETAVDVVSRNVSDGNTLVFQELAPVFSDMVDILEAPGGGRSEEAFEALLGRLRPGESSSEGPGQDELRQALCHYRDARLACNPKVKSELILLGNARIALHEQTRLQRHIETALSAPAQVGLDRVLHLRNERGRRLGSFPWYRMGGPTVLARPAAARAVARTRQRVVDKWEETATEFLVHLSTPEGDLALGRKLDLLPPGLPRHLATLDHPGLRAMLRRFPSPDRSWDRGADNWAVLTDRMGFILELFRSRQHLDRYFEAPFTPAQRDTIAAGYKPAGSL